MPWNEQDEVERADRLDRFWDEVVRGFLHPTSAPEMDPGSAEVVRRLEALDVAPDSAEVRERVWRRLQEQASSQAGGVERASPGTIEPGLTTLNGRVPVLEPRPSTPVPHRLRRLGPLLQFAAVAALILGLLGGYFAGPRTLPDILDPWRDPISPAVPMSRGGPARTGEFPGPGPANVPSVQWQVRTGRVQPASPALVDDTIYVGTDDRLLLALDAASGTERWRFVTDGAVGGSAAVVDGVVYVGDEAGFLYAVDAATGEQRWRVDFGTSLYTAAPAVVDGVIYLTSGAGGTAPAVVDGIVYVGGDGSASRSTLLAHAVDAATGEERWRHNVARNGLFALDATTGEEHWHVATFAPIYHSSPAVTDGTVYVGSKDGTVYAVDAVTGEERWRFTTGKAVYASPAVVDGIVYIGSTDGFLYALDAATGQQRWRLETGVVQRSSAAVADGNVYVVGGNYLLAVDAMTGVEHWRVSTGGNGEGSPVVVDGTIYVGGRIGDVNDPTANGTGVLLALTEESGP